MACHKRIILILSFILGFYFSFSQAIPKKLAAKRTTASIKIDGNIDEEAWKDAPVATDFVELRPKSGAKEQNKTIVKILYDNNFIYVGGYCYESSQDSIAHELAGRDQVGNSDFIGIIFDTYHDRLNAVGFYVTTTGEQYDAKYSGSNGNEDPSWNAVWESEAKIHKDGWSFEMKIPYSALRFTSKDNQTWGLNITRRRQKTSQQFFWNEVSPNVNGFISQEGDWTGIGKIQSPIRLSFSPYFSVYANNYPYNTPGLKNTTASVNGGMDIKYGISQSFTLDMTLIPDFGQVQSDNIVFNRTPFEVKYAENRPFFTEGTELFNKGNLFYTRRVGGVPLNAYNISLNANEQVINNPLEARLINATKFSGRTAGGLGIGVFNAVTQKMFAEVQDTVTGIKRQVETSPLTNYNVFVLDQTLKNNSSVSFINTNVSRGGGNYNADVMAGLFDLNNKKNTYNFNGKFSLSTLYAPHASNVEGYSHDIGFGKPGGRFNFFLEETLLDDKYNYNDLGLMFHNNYLDHYIYLGYKWLKPKSWYNNLYYNFNFTYSRRYNPSSYQDTYLNMNVNGQLKNLSNVGIMVGYNAPGNDFYEPHQEGYLYKTPSIYFAQGWYNSLQAKAFSYSVTTTITKKDIDQNIQPELMLSGNYRFNDKFALGFSTDYTVANHDIGFAAIDPNNNDVVFSLRKLYTIGNILSGKYNFNKYQGITLKIRHYWSETVIQNLYTLQPSGSLVDNHTYTGDANQNFNVFNIDMVYTWQFAPGSFVNLVWKNSATGFNEIVDKNYFRNFNETLSSPQNNNVSLKILYYLDYIKLRRNKKTV